MNPSLYDVKNVEFYLSVENSDHMLRYNHQIKVNLLKSKNNINNNKYATKQDFKVVDAKFAKMHMFAEWKYFLIVHLKMKLQHQCKLKQIYKNIIN